MQELTFQDIYNEIKKLHPNEDVNKNIEGALSLWTLGMFDAYEGSNRENAIQKARKILEL